MLEFCISKYFTYIFVLGEVMKPPLKMLKIYDKNFRRIRKAV